MICFIPARSGSRGVLHKNIKLLGGKPLIQWSIETGRALGLRTIVDTDSVEYVKIAQSCGAEVMLRPKELGQDDTSMYELLKYEVRRIKPIPTSILLFQPTSPFRDVGEIKMGLKYFSGSAHSSLIGVERISEKYNPAQVIVQKRKGIVMADGRLISDRLSRRQDFIDAFIPTGSLYIFETKNFRDGFFRKGNLYGLNVGIFSMEPTININTIEDWEEAERLCVQK